MSLRALLFAAGLAAGAAIPAAADAAYTTGSVNVRGGPGTNYYVIATAPPGAWVDVHNCYRGWCNVTYARVNGWMSANYIAYGGQPRYYPQPQPYAYPLPPPPPPPGYYYPRPYYPYPYRYPRYPRQGPSYGFWFGFRG
jgi:uncharacterized protein YraI